jgi:hypothetical protein
MQSNIWWLAERWQQETVDERETTVMHLRSLLPIKSVNGVERAYRLLDIIFESVPIAERLQ